MFGCLFRIINTIVLLVILSVGLAFWKGGEPFRWVGDGMVIIGEQISEAGNIVDEMIDGGNQVKDSYNELKDVVGPEDN